MCKVATRLVRLKTIQNTFIKANRWWVITPTKAVHIDSVQACSVHNHVYLTKKPLSGNGGAVLTVGTADPGVKDANGRMHVLRLLVPFAR